jgi:hypothetical protein
MATSTGVVWPSNWIILRQCLWRGLCFGAFMEAGMAAATLAGVIRGAPGLMFVVFWCAETSGSFAIRRDRIDGVPGALVMGLLLASLFGAVSWLVTALAARWGRALAPPLTMAGWLIGFTLVLVWGIAAARSFREGHVP